MKVVGNTLRVEVEDEENEVLEYQNWELRRFFDLSFSQYLSEEQILAILRKGVIARGNFSLPDEIHGYWRKRNIPVTSSIFVNFRQIAISHVREIAVGLAERFTEKGINVVFGVKDYFTGLLVHEIGDILGVNIVYAELQNRFHINLAQNYALKEGARVLIVFDISSTGFTVKQLLKIVKKNRGIIAGIGGFIVRNETALKEIIPSGTMFESICQLRGLLGEPFGTPIPYVNK